MKGLFIFLSFCIPYLSFGQITYSNGAAEIIYENCTACHNVNGIGPFSLMDYESVLQVGIAIPDVVGSGYMPPWTADNTYQTYAHNRAMSEEDKADLIEWVSNGMPLGNELEVPPPPVYTNQGFIQATPDLELEMEPYISQASFMDDDYICISLPTGLTEDKKLKAFEVVPGNPSILHHCLVYIDPEGTYPTSFSGECVGPNNDEGLIGGYTPGAVPTVFPSNGADVNMGITIPAGSNIVMAMHYPHGSAGEEDQTKIRLYFYEDDVEIREVLTYPILANWFFYLPPNQMQDVSAQFNQIQNDISVLSVFPHMHLLGDKIKAYALDPSNDTIPLIRVNNWDFEWQEFFFFDQIQVIPAGSVLKGEGTYNNTASNPNNPNDPIIGVGAGLNTTDEMFLIYFHFLGYEEGDEDLDIESLTQLPVGIEELIKGNNDVISVYPNPTEDIVNFTLRNKTVSKASLFVYDSKGRLVEKVIHKRFIPANAEGIQWETKDVHSGIYFYSLMLDGDSYTGKIVVR